MRDHDNMSVGQMLHEALYRTSLILAAIIILTALMGIATFVVAINVNVFWELGRWIDPRKDDYLALAAGYALMVDASVLTIASLLRILR